MQRILTLLLICIVSVSCSSRSEQSDKQAIISIMKTQEKAWSNHDLEGFMEGYWKNDSLKFYGSSGLTYGWQQTLDNYKKGYPTADHSGKLNFTIDDITKIEDDSYFVMGDNRNGSSDARFWGFVPEDHIVGKPKYVWLSLDKEKKFLSKIRFKRMFMKIQ